LLTFSVQRMSVFAELIEIRRKNRLNKRNRSDRNTQPQAHPQYIQYKCRCTQDLFHLFHQEKSFFVK
jgi:hypothetical protein